MTTNDKTTILLIDDENTLNEYLKVLLNQAGYNVITARDGLSGIELFSEHSEAIDIVVMDMIMPHMCGTDCFYELKQIDPNVNVIVISGYSQQSGIDYLMRDGVKAFLKKPFSSNVIIGKIEEVLHAAD